MKKMKRRRKKQKDMKNVRISGKIRLCNEWICLKKLLFCRSYLYKLNDRTERKARRKTSKERRRGK